MSVTASVIDDTLLMADASPSGGTTFERRDVEVLVTGAKDAEQAKSEAIWRARQDADGEGVSVTFHTTEGPDWAGNYIVRVTTEATRYW